MDLGRIANKLKWNDPDPTQTDDLIMLDAPTDTPNRRINGNNKQYGSLADERTKKEAVLTEDEDEATFLKLLQRNREFRLYILSYVTTHMGEWLTYIASIALAEELLTQQGISSRTTISILVVVRLLPNVLLSPFGGILADGRDRRESMIFLDVVGAISPLLFLLAMHFQSIPLIYLVTFLQQVRAVT